MVSDRKKVSAPQQKRNAAETRNRLLQAARRLFATANYVSVGIREIGAEAGVNPALISRYFGSKRNLFLEVGAYLMTRAMLPCPTFRRWKEPIWP